MPLTQINGMIWSFARSSENTRKWKCLPSSALVWCRSASSQTKFTFGRTLGQRVHTLFIISGYDVTPEADRHLILKDSYHPYGLLNLWKLVKGDCLEMSHVQLVIEMCHCLCGGTHPWRWDFCNSSTRSERFTLTKMEMCAKRLHCNNFTISVALTCE